MKAIDFIKVLDPIPANKWCTHERDNGKGQYCVLGHIDVHRENGGILNSLALMNLVNSCFRNYTSIQNKYAIHCINNGDTEFDEKNNNEFRMNEEFISKFGSTPKERVLNVLAMIDAGIPLHEGK